MEGGEGWREVRGEVRGGGGGREVKGVRATESTRQYKVYVQRSSSDRCTVRVFAFRSKRNSARTEKRNGTKPRTGV